MPFLTEERFQQIIPKDLAVQVTKDPGAFERAQQTVASVIVARTGIAEPAVGSEDTSASWVQWCVAVMIFWNRIGALGDIGDQLRQWAQEQNRQALALLDQNRTANPAGAVASSTGAIGGLAEW